VLGVANVPSSPRLTYVFTPISVGPDRGATAAQIAVESERSAARRPHRLANQVLAFLVGGFAARTTEGALRAELDSLAAACADRLRARSGHRTAA
jgi:hypothetical protein